MTLTYGIEHETMLGEDLLHLAEAEDELLNDVHWIYTLISTVKLT